MITNRQRYEDRHRRIIQRAERDFAESKLTVAKTVKTYAAAVRRAIRHGDSIAAVYATAAAYIAMKGQIDYVKSANSADLITSDSDEIKTNSLLNLPIAEGTIPCHAK